MNNSVDITSLFLQALSLEILFKDFNNSDLMTELQKQDTEYFEKLLRQQEEILTILKEGGINNGRKSNESN